MLPAAVGLLEPADPVLEPRRPRQRPRPRQALVARVGQKLLVGLAVGYAKAGSISGRSATSGISHGSEEEARNVSESRITGVR